MPEAIQSFAETASPDQGPPRLAQLRAALAEDGLAGCLVPRADAHQGECVAACDERLAWLTGFTGSAGLCAVLADTAAMFVDGRYRAQIRLQTDPDHFAPLDSRETPPEEWLRERLADGGAVGFDPWLHTRGEIDRMEQALEGTGIELCPIPNPVDRLWDDRPAPPMGRIWAYPEELAGESHAAKRERLAQELREAGHRAAVITLADSVAWLLNIRGADLPRTPAPRAFAILHDTGETALFADDAKIDAETRAHLGDGVAVLTPDSFAAELRQLEGPVRVTRASAPIAVEEELRAAGVALEWGADPCVLPKAAKNAAELAATREAHLRDGAAMCAFLAWLDDQPPGAVTEIDVVERLEERRRATGRLLDISFDTIAGSGPHGAIIHYRVTENSNRTLEAGDLLVLDSGGQYLDGTTDVTRTLAVGAPGAQERAVFTRVLQGMIAISRARWPRGLAGRDLDALARQPLWLADLDYGHGTGHGVGVCLSVHEGPQGIGPRAEIPLEPGMILSNEPGHYREGAFGIRIENLVAVIEADPLPGGADGRLCFETLTFVPIDRRLIEPGMLTEPERAWLDGYHRSCLERIGPLLDGAEREWLERAAAPL